MTEKFKFNYLIDERRYELITESGKPLSQVVDEFIKNHTPNFDIKNEEDYKAVWSHRTAINGLAKDIAEARKQTVAVMTNPLVNSCKPLEKRLQEISDELTAKMLEFKPKETKPKTTTIITIELPVGSEQIEKVKTYLKKLNVGYKEE